MNIIIAASKGTTQTLYAYQWTVSVSITGGRVCVCGGGA